MLLNGYFPSIPSLHSGDTLTGARISRPSERVAIPVAGFFRDRVAVLFIPGPAGEANDETLFVPLPAATTLFGQFNGNCRRKPAASA